MQHPALEALEDHIGRRRDREVGGVDDVGLVRSEVGEAPPHQADRPILGERWMSGDAFGPRPGCRPGQAGGEVGPEHQVVGRDRDRVQLVANEVEVPWPHDPLDHRRKSSAYQAGGRRHNGRHDRPVLSVGILLPLRDESVDDGGPEPVGLEAGRAGEPSGDRLAHGGLAGTGGSVRITRNGSSMDANGNGWSHRPASRTGVNGTQRAERWSVEALVGPGSVIGCVGSAAGWTVHPTAAWSADSGPGTPAPRRPEDRKAPVSVLSTTVRTVIYPPLTAGVMMVLEPWVRSAVIGSMGCSTQGQCGGAVGERVSRVGSRGHPCVACGNGRTERL